MSRFELLLFFVVASMAHNAIHVCFREECSTTVDHCPTLCRFIGYNIGHCGNWTRVPNPYKRRTSRQAGHAGHGTHGGGSPDNGHLVYKLGESCQCHGCNRTTCDAYCNNGRPDNCLSLAEHGADMEICACGKRATRKQLRSMFDHLCRPFPV